MAKDQRKIKSDFGTVTRRGDVVNINLRIGVGADDRLPVDMRVSINTRSGRVSRCTGSQIIQT